MGNCKAGLSLGHFIVDLKKVEDVKGSLYSLIDSDGDLTENVDYFQDDTLDLGYNNEADRIVSEYVKEHGVPRSVKAFKKAADEVFEAISDQEYYGECEINIISLGNKKIVVAVATGGQYFG